MRGLRRLVLMGGAGAEVQRLHLARVAPKPPARVAGGAKPSAALSVFPMGDGVHVLLLFGAAMAEDEDEASTSASGSEDDDAGEQGPSKSPVALACRLLAEHAVAWAGGLADEPCPGGVVEKFNAAASEEDIKQRLRAGVRLTCVYDIVSPAWSSFEWLRCVRDVACAAPHGVQLSFLQEPERFHRYYGLPRLLSFGTRGARPALDRDWFSQLYNDV